MADKPLWVRILGRDETKPAFDGAKKNASQFADFTKALGLDRLFDKIAQYAGDAFGRIKDEALGAEAGQAQLRNTLANVGLDYAKLAPQIDKVITATSRLAGVDDDELTSALDNMIKKSGDYRGSLKAIPLVADVAAGAQLSLAEASDVVGKALAGQTKGLKQFGITTTDAHAGLDQLAKKFRNAAATDLSTFGGALKANDVAIGNVAQALGEAITKTPYFARGIKAMTDGINTFADWLTTNRAEIGYWASVVAGALKLIVVETYNLSVALGASMAWVIAEVMLQTVNFTNSINGVIAAGFARLGMYSKAAEIMAGETSTATLEKAVADAKAAGDAATTTMGRTWDEFSDMVQRGAEEQGKTVGHAAGAAAGAATDAATQAAKEKLKKFLDEISKAAGGFLKGRLSGDFSPTWTSDDPNFRDPNKGPLAGDAVGHGLNLGPIDLSGLGKGLPQAAGGVAGALGSALYKAMPDEVLDQATGKLKTFHQELKDVADTAVTDLGGGFASAFMKAGAGAQSLGRGMKQAFGGAIAGAAKKEGDYFEAKALGALGDAVLFGNPGALLAFGEYQAAAAGMYLVAGAGGSIGASRAGSGGASAGSGAGGYASGAQGALSDASKGSGQVVVEGFSQFDMANYAQRAALQEAVREATGLRDFEFIVR